MDFFFENEIDMILTICGGEEIHRNERKVVRDGERERESTAVSLRILNSDRSIDLLTSD